jgi:hypothetical protein
MRAGSARCAPCWDTRPADRSNSIARQPSRTNRAVGAPFSPWGGGARRADEGAFDAAKDPAVVGRHPRADRHDRPGVRLARDVDGVARQEPRAVGGHAQAAPGAGGDLGRTLAGRERRRSCWRRTSAAPPWRSCTGRRTHRTMPPRARDRRHGADAVRLAGRLARCRPRAPHGRGHADAASGEGYQGGGGEGDAAGRSLAARTRAGGRAAGGAADTGEEAGGGAAEGRGAQAAERRPDDGSATDHGSAPAWTPPPSPRLRLPARPGPRPA